VPIGLLKTSGQLKKKDPYTVPKLFTTPLEEGIEAGYSRLSRLTKRIDFGRRTPTFS